MESTTPLTATSQFIQAGARKKHELFFGFVSRVPADDDDDLDEEAIPSFSNPALATEADAPNKGKSRAQDQLAQPTGSIPPGAVSGNIGSSSGGNTNRPSTRRTVGGVQVETR